MKLYDFKVQTIRGEEKLLADAVQAGEAIVARTGLPIRTPWPVL